jgi:hypothetical protein
MTEEDRERFVRMESKLNDNGRSLGILFKGIEGNGQPGLKDRMTGLEVKLSDHLLLHSQAPARKDNVIQIVALLVMIIISSLGWFRGV